MATIPSSTLYPATSGVYPSGNVQVTGTVAILEASGSAGS